MKIHNCISVCTKKDAYVWSYASDRILKYIDAEKYTVIVPSQYVDLFKRISNPKFDVVDESVFAPEFSLQYVASHMPEEQRGRAGWYYQQLLKIKALAQYDNTTIRQYEIINLIWDADTIPLRKMEFIKDNKLVYYMGTEHNKPYFAFTSKLMGLGKLVNFSFIAQNFVANSSWVREFLSMLTNKYQSTWFDAILGKIDFQEISGFSEYETLGTYFVKNYSDKMLVSKQTWNRDGCSICHIEDIDLYEIYRIPNQPLFVCYEMYEFSETFQELLHSFDDEKLVSFIENKKHGSRWRRFKHLVSILQKNILQNPTQNKKTEYHPIETTFLIE